MSASDGSIAGQQKVVDNGPDSERYNIAILGDGYRKEELAQFAPDVDTFVALMKSTAPYDRTRERPTRRAGRFWPGARAAHYWSCRRRPGACWASNWRWAAAATFGSFHWR